MTRCQFLSIALALAAGPLFGNPESRGVGERRQGQDFSKWEKAIVAFEKKDRENPPRPGGVLFIGSSSIRGWNLEKFFPRLGAVNRGFGGSELADSIHFAPRILFPHQPSTIVLYAGDNDISRKKTAETVVTDYHRFVKSVHERLPKARIIFVAIKPSISRWKLWPEMKKANAQIAAHAKGDARLLYADIASPMLGEDGRPRKALFVKDGLHLNEAGYRLWTGILAPLIGGRAQEAGNSLQE